MLTSIGRDYLRSLGAVFGRSVSSRNGVSESSCVTDLAAFSVKP